MIWVVLLILAAAILLYICAPLFSTGKSSQNQDASVQAYGEKINELEQRIAAEGDDLVELTEAKTAMQRKALDAATERAPASSLSAKSIFISIAAVFGVSTVVLYSQLGTPNLLGGQSNAEQDLEGLSLEQLIVRLEENLEADPANPNGWIYYARSLTTVGRHEDALAAYDRALVLTNSD